MDDNFAVWGQTYTSKAMYIAERSLVLTPATALVNIAKAAFHAYQAARTDVAEKKTELKDQAWKELKHGLKTLLPVLGFVFVVIPKIYKDTKAYYAQKNAEKAAAAELKKAQVEEQEPAKAPAPAKAPVEPMKAWAEKMKEGFAKGSALSFI